MVMDILSIPAMNDESGRIFSGARRTISWEKAQLRTENIEKVEYLKYWNLNDISKEDLILFFYRTIASNCQRLIFLMRCLPTQVPYCQALSFLLSIISIIDRGFIALSKTTLGKR
jgi:hypothetical protein